MQFKIGNRVTEVAGPTDLFILVYIFLLIYSPRLVTYNTLHILAFIALVGSFAIYKSVIKTYKETKLRYFSVSMISLGIWCVIVSWVNNTDIIVTLYRFFVLSIELPICVVFIMAVMRKRHYSIQKLFITITQAGVIQAIIAVAMILSPSFKTIINNHYSQFWDTRYIGWSINRMYGFSDNLLHTTPMVQSIIIVVIIIFISSIKGKKTFLLALPLIGISVIVNARTAFIVMCIILLLYIVFGANLTKKIKWLFAIIVFVIVFFPLLNFLLMQYAPIATEYFFSGINEIKSFLEGNIEDNTFFDAVLNDFFVFPRRVSENIFGTGTSIISGINYESKKIQSDIGYINDVWQGGIFFSIAICIVYIRLIKSLEWLNIKNARWLYLTMLFFFLFGNFKGIITTHNDYTVLLLLLTSSSVLLGENNRSFLYS